MRKKDLTDLWANNDSARSDLRALAEVILELRDRRVWAYSNAPKTLRDTPCDNVGTDLVVDPEYLRSRHDTYSRNGLETLTASLPVDGRFGVQWGKLCDEHGLEYTDGRGQGRRRVTLRVRGPQFTAAALKAWASIVAAHAHLGNQCRVEVMTASGEVVVHGPVVNGDDGFGDMVAMIAPTTLLGDVAALLGRMLDTVNAGGGVVPSKGRLIVLHPADDAHRDEWIARVRVLGIEAARRGHADAVARLVARLERMADLPGHSPKAVEHLTAALACLGHDGSAAEEDEDRPVNGRTFKRLSYAPIEGGSPEC